MKQYEINDGKCLDLLAVSIIYCSLEMNTSFPSGLEYMSASSLQDYFKLLSVAVNVTALNSRSAKHETVSLKSFKNKISNKILEQSFLVT